MNIIEQAKDFVNRLHPNDPRRYPHCHKRMTKKNGTRPVTIADTSLRILYQLMTTSSKAPAST